MKKHQTKVHSHHKKPPHGHQPRRSVFKLLCDLSTKVDLLNALVAKSRRAEMYKLDRDSSSIGKQLDLMATLLAEHGQPQLAQQLREHAAKLTAMAQPIASDSTTSNL